MATLANTKEREKQLMRVPNYKLDRYFANLSPVENYNGTIRAEWRDGIYTVWHWNTPVFRYEQSVRSCDIVSHFISQTTSTLLGRIVRSFPDGRAIADAVDVMPSADKRRFVAMSKR